MRRELLTVNRGSFTQKLKGIFQRMQLDQGGSLLPETLGSYAQNHVDLLKNAGVLAGLTNISQIVATKFVDGKKKPCDGELAEFKKVLGEARTFPLFAAYAYHSYNHYKKAAPCTFTCPTRNFLRRKIC